MDSGAEGKKFPLETGNSLWKGSKRPGLWMPCHYSCPFQHLTKVLGYVTDESMLVLEYITLLLQCAGGFARPAHDSERYRQLSTVLLLPQISSFLPSRAGK